MLSVLLFLIIGYFIGYFSCFFFYGRKVGDKGILPNIRIRFRNYIISPHHWIYFLFSIITFIYLIIVKRTFYNSFLLLIGFSFGGFFQGISYKDRFIIIKKIN